MAKKWTPYNLGEPTLNDLQSSGYWKFVQALCVEHAASMQAIDDAKRERPESAGYLKKRSLREWAWDLVVDTCDHLTCEIDVETGYSDESSVGLSSHEPYIIGVYCDGEEVDSPTDWVFENTLAILKDEFGFELNDDSNPVDEIMYWEIFSVCSRATDKRIDS